MKIENHKNGLLITVEKNNSVAYFSKYNYTLLITNKSSGIHIETIESDTGYKLNENYIIEKVINYFRSGYEPCCEGRRDKSFLSFIDKKIVDAEDELNKLKFISKIMKRKCIIRL